MQSAAIQSHLQLIPNPHNNTSTTSENWLLFIVMSCVSQSVRPCSHLWAFSSYYGEASMGERLSKLYQSCFCGTIHIEVTGGDSYASDNVWVIRFSPGVNKVTSQEKIACDCLCNCIKLDFTDCNVPQHFSWRFWEMHRGMGGVFIASSVNRIVGDIGWFWLLSCL